MADRNRSVLSRSPLTARITENIGRHFLVERCLVLRRGRAHWYSDWFDALLRREIFLAPSRINCTGSLMRDEENLCAETGQLGAVPTENRTGRPDKKPKAPDPSPDSTSEEYRKRAAEGKHKIRGSHVVCGYWPRLPKIRSHSHRSLISAAVLPYHDRT